MVQQKAFHATCFICMASYSFLPWEIPTCFTWQSQHLDMLGGRHCKCEWRGTSWFWLYIFLINGPKEKQHQKTCSAILWVLEPFLDMSLAIPGWKNVIQIPFEVQFLWLSFTISTSLGVVPSVGPIWSVGGIQNVQVWGRNISVELHHPLLCPFLKQATNPSSFHCLGDITCTVSGNPGSLKTKKVVPVRMGNKSEFEYTEATYSYHLLKETTKLSSPWFWSYTWGLSQKSDTPKNNRG